MEKNSHCCEIRQTLEGDIEYSAIDNSAVFPSKEESIFVQTDGIYGGAHKYFIKKSLGFENGEAKYVNDFVAVDFVQKSEDGKMTSGIQSEQLALILLDRVKKLNKVYPDPNNNQQVEGLLMYLDARAQRVTSRIERGVMGKLEK